MCEFVRVSKVGFEFLVEKYSFNMSAVRKTHIFEFTVNFLTRNLLNSIALVWETNKNLQLNEKQKK